MNGKTSVRDHTWLLASPKFKYGQGVLLAAEDTPMKNIVFEDVRVINAENPVSASYIKCQSVSEGVARFVHYIQFCRAEIVLYL